MIRIHGFVALFCATSAVAPLAASAAPITIPTGLNPGDQYRLAFVTSTTRDATSGDINDYNYFVTAVANSVPELAAVGTTWKAIASTPGTNAAANTGTNSSPSVPIYTLANTLIASSNADLWDGDITNPLNVCETGTAYSAIVWTGSWTDGVSYVPRLGDYVAIQNGYAPVWGRSDSTGQTWIAQTYDTITNLHSLYAMSNVLTVVPEPSTMVLACLAAAGLAVVSLRLRRR